MTETEIAGLIVATILVAIFVVGMALDGWERWQSRRRHKRLLQYLDNANRDRWYDRR
jgi:hypothetical protein